ncbi:hypothetical protein JCM9957A_50920 [Kineosporia succinea]
MTPRDCGPSANSRSTSATRPADSVPDASAIDFLSIARTPWAGLLKVRGTIVPLSSTDETIAVVPLGGTFLLEREQGEKWPSPGETNC